MPQKRFAGDMNHGLGQIGKHHAHACPRLPANIAALMPPSNPRNAACDIAKHFPFDTLFVTKI
jgi:hypothetical protein